MARDPRVADLVQAGEIRLAIFLPQYAKGAAGGAVHGIGMGLVAIEMGHALAARLGIALRLIEYPTPVAAAEAIKSGNCDFACLGIDPARAGEIDFSPAIVQFDYTILVPTGSSIRTCADADCPGSKIAVVHNHASTFALRRKAKHAELIGRDLPDAAFELLRAGTVHGFAAPREQLIHYAAKLPGSRVLDDSYGVNNAGIAIAKGQAGRLGFICEFVEEAKTSGLIAGIIQRGGLRGFQVAPPANAAAQ